MFITVLNVNLFAHSDLLSQSYRSCQKDWQEVGLEPYHNVREIQKICSLCSKKGLFKELQFYLR